MQPISGNYEHDGEISEDLQIAVPEDDQEREAIAEAILPHQDVVDEDSARRGYLFNYELDRHLGEGMYALRVSARDASEREHAVEIAAGLVITGATERRIEEGVPMWLISERIHFDRLRGSPLPYGGTAFGRLHLFDPERVPQRRLFGARPGD